MVYNASAVTLMNIGMDTCASNAMGVKFGMPSRLFANV